jgi:hypothetical protein
VKVKREKIKALKDSRSDKKKTPKRKAAALAVGGNLKRLPASKH